jgi:predicted HTH domain antitoxin/predicted RNA-binding protein
MRNLEKNGDVVMESVYRISKTELARKIRQVFHSVQRGGAVIVESHGQPEAAILDIPDYYILRAVTRYQAGAPEIDPDAGLPDEALSGLEEQERYQQVVAHYLAGGISLGRAAELLELPWVDLRARLQRLGVPILAGPESVDELRQEIKALKAWEGKRKNRSPIQNLDEI